MTPNTTDRQILALLQANGRMSNVELAEHIGLSESPCFRRVKQLENSGIIEGHHILIYNQKDVSI